MARVSAAVKAEQERVATAEQIAKLTKDLEHAKAMQKYNDDRATEAQKELDGVHQIIDVLPGSLKRDKPDGYSKNSAQVRLASHLAWVATRAHSVA